MLQSYHKLQIRFAVCGDVVYNDFRPIRLMYYSGFINIRVIGFENLEGAMQSVTQ